eukprot:gene4877-8471_t
MDSNNRIEYQPVKKSPTFGKQPKILSCTVGCCISLCCFLSIIFLIASFSLGYTIWYIFPYIPIIKNQNFELFDFKFDPSSSNSIFVNGNVTFSTSYQGRIEIPIDHVVVDVKYKGIKMATVQKMNIGLIKPQTTSQIRFEINDRIENIPDDVLKQMTSDIVQKGEIVLEFDGKAYVRYLGIPVSFPIHFEKTIKPNQ